MKMSKNSIFGHFWPKRPLFGPPLLARTGQDRQKGVHFITVFSQLPPRSPLGPQKRPPKTPFWTPKWPDLAISDPSDGHFGPLEGSKSAIFRQTPSPQPPNPPSGQAPPIISVSTSVQKRPLFWPFAYANFDPFWDKKRLFSTGKTAKGVKNRVRGPPKKTPKKGSISPYKTPILLPPPRHGFCTHFKRGVCGEPV